MLLESPRWLLARRRGLEAKSVLVRLDGDASDAEYLMIRESVRQEMAVQDSWSQILRGGQATRRMFLGMLLQVWCVISLFRLEPPTDPSSTSNSPALTFLLLSSASTTQKCRIVQAYIAFIGYR